MQIFILQTIGGFGPGGETSGGVLQLLRLLEEWTASGHEVHFITNAWDKGSDQYRGGYYVHRLPSSGLMAQPTPFQFLMEMLFNPLVQWRSLQRLVSERMKPPVVVIANSPYLSDVLAAFSLSHHLGAPAAVHFHHLSPPPWWHPRPRGNLFRVTANWFLWLTALSLAKVGGLLPILHQPKEIDQTGWKFPEIMPDPGFLEPEYEEGLSDSPTKYAACFIGRLAPNKGVLDLVRVWRNVTRWMPDAKLVIAGNSHDERYGRKIEETIHQLGLQDRIERRGPPDDREKRELLAMSRLFVFPSYEEGWSLSVMEAALCKVVPVVYDLPAYQYLNCEDVKVPVGSISDMAKVVLQLLKDPTRTASIAERLSSRVKEYRKESIAQEEARYLEQFARSRSIKGR